MNLIAQLYISDAFKPAPTPAVAPVHYPPISLAALYLEVYADEFAAPPAPPAPRVVRDGANITGRWLGDNWARVYPHLRRAVSRKMLASVNAGLVDEHISQFLVKMIKNNSLAKFLDAGMEVKLSVLAVWVQQVSLSDAKTWTTDASTRETRGCHAGRDKVKAPTDGARRIIRGEDGEQTEDYTSPATLAGHEAVEAEEARDHLTEALARQFGSRAPAVRGFLDALRAGDGTVKDLSARYGVNPADLLKVSGRIREMYA